MNAEAHGPNNQGPNNHKDQIMSDPTMQAMVRAALDKILLSPLFRDTTRLKRFLRYVVEATLKGEGARLKGYTIGVDVFDRAKDFDPQADTIVRVQAGQLRRRMDLYYASDGQNDPLRIVIPKGRYAPSFEIRTKPLAPANEAETDPKIAKIEHHDRPGILVVGLKDYSSQNAASYLADGITAEIVNALIQFRYLRIITHSQAGQNADSLKEAARRYGAQFILSGHIQCEGDKIRISVNIIEVETWHTIYSKIMDRDFTPEALFEMQDEIASYFAVSIGAPFGAINRHNRRLNNGRRQSLRGYHFILRYYHLNLAPTAQSVETLIEEGEALLDDKPRFSTAWAILALLHAFLIGQTLPPDMSHARQVQMMKAARRATIIDPDNAFAFYALFVAHFHKGEIDAYDRAAKRALALNPNDYNILAHLAACEAALGRYASAQKLYADALGRVARPPVWFHSAEFALALNEERYGDILAISGPLTDTTPSAAQIFGAAALGFWGQNEGSEAFITRLRADPEAFLVPARQILDIWQTDQALRDKIEEGWKRLGLS